MTEFWKSNPKHWCKECKIFIDAKAASIRTHEQGARHREAAKRKLRTMMKDKMTKQAVESGFASDIAAIEYAAQNAFRKDVEAGNAAKRETAQLENVMGKGGYYREYFGEDEAPPVAPSFLGTNDPITKPEVAPPPGMQKAAAAEWCYKDELETIHGPFRLAVMQNWYNKGHFQEKTLIQRIAPVKTEFRNLQEWPEILGISDSSSESEDSGSESDSDGDADKFEVESDISGSDDEDSTSSEDKIKNESELKQKVTSSEPPDHLKTPKEKSQAGRDAVYGAWISVNPAAHFKSKYQKRLEEEQQKSKRKKGVKSEDGSNKKMKTEHDPALRNDFSSDEDQDLQAAHREIGYGDLPSTTHTVVSTKPDPHEEERMKQALGVDVSLIHGDDGAKREKVQFRKRKRGKKGGQRKFRNKS